MLPISVQGTPDERPLEPAEIAVLRKHLPGLRIRYHNAAARIVNRFLFRGPSKIRRPSPEPFTI